MPIPLPFRVQLNAASLRDGRKCTKFTIVYDESINLAYFYTYGPSDEPICAWSSVPLIEVPQAYTLNCWPGGAERDSHLRESPEQFRALDQSFARQLISKSSVRAQLWQAFAAFRPGGPTE